MRQPMQSSLVGSSEKYRITSFAYLRKRSNLHNHGNIAKLFLFFFSLYKQIFPLYSVQQRNNCCSSLLRKPLLLIVFRVFLCGSVSLPRVSWICSLHGIRCTAAVFLSLERNWYKEYRLFFLFFCFLFPCFVIYSTGKFRTDHGLLPIDLLPFNLSSTKRISEGSLSYQDTLINYLIKKGTKNTSATVSNSCTGYSYRSG